MMCGAPPALELEKHQTRGTRGQGGGDVRTKEALAKSGTEKAESALDGHIGATRGRLWNVTI